MNLKIVEMPSLQELIRHCPGFKKKDLADRKLDICGLCAFGCIYCSSNNGNHLRINRKKFAAWTKEQIGELTLPADDPNLMFKWPDVILKLRAEVAKKRANWGAGETLVFSMLTDGFSPNLVAEGTTEAALRLVLEHTAFRIRVLTKNAIVGSKKWTNFFKEFPDRFVVGLSIGTLDDGWAKKIERHTPPPSSRIRALRHLQDEGVPTFGMLCPVFPEVLKRGNLEKLVAAIRPGLTEDVWAEPFNDRQNWWRIRDVLPAESTGHKFLTEVYENGNSALWSRYGTDLYRRIRDVAERDGWLKKFKYLLYEGLISEDDVADFGDRSGVLLQSTPDEDGHSQNPAFAAGND